MSQPDHVLEVGGHSFKQLHTLKWCIEPEAPTGGSSQPVSTAFSRVTLSAERRRNEVSPT
jgi:hypothetical protein